MEGPHIQPLEEAHTFQEHRLELDVAMREQTNFCWEADELLEKPETERDQSSRQNSARESALGQG